MRKFLKSLVEAVSLFWRGLDQARRLVVNILFLLLVVALIAWLLADDRPAIPETTALVIAPYGELVEQLSGDFDEQILLALTGERRPETLLRTMLEALEAAANDDRVQAVFLDLNRLSGGGLSKLQLLAAALAEFRTSGKPVIASGDFYTQPQFFLAATADEIYLHPMGMVLLTGYGSYRNYYRETLDRLAIDWNVFRVGEYKSAVEPYLRNDMSPEAREARERWLTVLWQTYGAEVEKARDLEPGTIARYADNLAGALEDHRGDAAALARSVGLVTQVAHRDEVRERMIELVGKDDDNGSFRQIDHRAYWRRMDREQTGSDGTVAVVVAKGGIYDGSQSPGVIGGDSTARLIRQAREDDQVKALVMRVDSPGGSAFASEIIRREVELTRQAGKPVVVSMSSVAASGGYWISMSADEIWAAPTTLTGSIGIYAMLPTFERTLQKLGIHNDGVGTGDLAGTLRPDRTLPEQAARAIELLIEQGYRQFLEGVSEGRGRTVEEVDSIARGRVWTGLDALNLGLVDRLGELEEALESAASRADLGDDYRVAYIEQEPDWRERLLGQFLLPLAQRLGPVRKPGWDLGVGPRALREVVEEPFELIRFGDPHGLYAYCFCEPD